ncbi:sigma factor-like helix-turn-helix DNA-binding protein [Wenjunlia tyrosinilytica]|uniref:DNA-directed RNA polymerase sigma-70 factor n=1 Tax=Wenjunlia tyrosinilytica TaxID=1544741 RepID=A0A918DTS9_9ACTN|nr:sigma factor-like helix-turn-helix DNA-binding protein [Wenjunlia tyrosinilytica]GGO83051.1 DNA-directed RNA polymerase sigma-70 factor [Wenjunlia tyrosinilytica]
MRSGHEESERRRSYEFEAFVGGAAGRLLHVAALLTCEDAKACDQLLCHALSRAYLNWTRLRGEDPYAYARQELVLAYARRAGARWLHREPRDGRLSRLTAQERLVLVLRLYEGVDEEQVAALLGMPVDRVRAVCARACNTLRSTPPAAAAPVAVPAVAGGAR